MRAITHSTPTKYLPQVDRCRSCKKMQKALKNLFDESKAKLLAHLRTPKGKTILHTVLIKTAKKFDDGNEETAMRHLLGQLRQRAAKQLAQKHGLTVTGNNTLLCRKCSDSRRPSFLADKQSPTNKRSVYRKKSSPIGSISADGNIVSMQVN